MNFFTKIFKKQSEEKPQTSAKEKQQMPTKNHKIEKKPDNKTGFSRTKSSDDWMQFMANLTVQLANKKNPAVILCFKSVSMAENMLKYRPDTVNSFLTQKPELIEFPDDNGAVNLRLKNISSLDRLIDLLFQGPFDDNLYLLHGIVAGLPITDHSAFLDSIGISNGTNIEDILVW